MGQDDCRRDFVQDLFGEVVKTQDAVACWGMRSNTAQINDPSDSRCSHGGTVVIRNLSCMLDDIELRIRQKVLAAGQHAIDSVCAHESGCQKFAIRYGAEC